MTRAEFMAGYRLLTSTFPFPPEAPDGYFEALRDLPTDLYLEAVRKSLKTCPRFPVPQEIRALVDSLPKSLPPAEDRTEALPEPVTLGVLPTGAPVIATAVYRHHCADCRDGGWFSFWCGAEPEGQQVGIVRHCGRTFPHYPHEYVERCACIATNPVIQRRKEAQAQYAASRTDQNQRRSA